MTKKSDPTCNKFLDEVLNVTRDDAQGLIEAQKHYGNSWKKRGGQNLFFMLARKWDRIEKRAEQRPNIIGFPPQQDSIIGDKYDIFQHLEADDRVEGLMDDIRDLRRYLTLIEAECRVMGLPCALGKQRDNIEAEKK